MFYYFMIAIIVIIIVMCFGGGGLYSGITRDYWGYDCNCLRPRY